MGQERFLPLTSRARRPNPDFPSVLWILNLAIPIETKLRFFEWSQQLAILKFFWFRNFFFARWRCGANFSRRQTKNIKFHNIIDNMIHYHFENLSENLFFFAGKFFSAKIYFKMPKYGELVKLIFRGIKLHFLKFPDRAPNINIVWKPKWLQRGPTNFRMNRERFAPIFGHHKATLVLNLWSQVTCPGISAFISPL